MADSMLCDNAEIVMGQSPPGATCNTTGNGLPLLNGPTEYGPHYPTPVQFTQDARKRARKGDILFCVRGSTTGRMNWADRDYAIGRGVAAIRHRTRPELQPFVRAVIEYGLPGLLAQATGSTFPNVSADQLAGLWWPPLEENEQRAIAHVLGTLDDKIELNRRMSETLEAMARALFKSWFVDFDPVRAKAEGRDLSLPKPLADLFPGSFEESELGEIPKGWEVKSIAEVAARVGMGPFGSSIKVESFVPEGVPVISGQHLNGVMLEDTTFNFITKGHSERLKAANVQRGDVLFTHAGNIGQVAYIPGGSRYDRYVLSQRQFFMRPDPALVSPSFVAFYFRSVEGRHRLLANTSSSGVPSLARPVTYLRSIRLTIPSRPILAAFETLVQPLLARSRRNQDETHTLDTLRDTLLPKLISGEVRVKRADTGTGAMI